MTSKRGERHFVQRCHSVQMLSSSPEKIFISFFVLVMGPDPHMLSKGSTPELYQPCFYFNHETGSHNHAKLTLNLQFLCLSLLTSWYYRVFYATIHDFQEMFTYGIIKHFMPICYLCTKLYFFIDHTHIYMYKHAHPCNIQQPEQVTTQHMMMTHPSGPPD